MRRRDSAMGVGRARRWRLRMPGFTVLEVMVAMMLLAVAVTSIFGAQFSAVATADYSRNVTQAIQLARCRMNEIELQFQIDDGFEQGDVNGSGECCEVVEGEADTEVFECSWEIKTIEFPDISQMMSGGGADGGTLDDFMGGGGMDDGADDMDSMGMLSAVAPMITDLLQEAIRRVTVKVEWSQGSRQRELEVAQYVVHPTQGPLQLMQQAAAMDEGAEAEMAGEERPRGGGVLPGGGGGKSDR